MSKTQTSAVRPPSCRRGLARIGMPTVVLAVLSTAVWTNTARAVIPGNACDDNNAPQCQQVVASGTLGRLGSTGYAIYCPADAPYYWGNYEHAFSRAGTVTENPFAEEGDPSKADFTVTNWSALGSNDWAISIDCSPISQAGNCSNPNTHEVSDPGCPIINQSSVCGGSDNCWLEWNERCVNGGQVTNYFCAAPLFYTQCWTCD